MAVIWNDNTVTRKIHKDSSSIITTSFTKIPIRRGFYIVKDLLSLIEKHNGFIAGGFAAYMLAPESYLDNKGIIVNSQFDLPKDIDVFCNTIEDYNNLVLDMSVDYNEISRYDDRSQEVFNDFVRTFSPSSGILAVLNLKVQIIKPRTINNGCLGINPITTIDAFDFTVSRAVIIRDFDSANGEYVGLADNDFEKDWSKKILSVKNIQSPIGCMIRLSKYLVNKNYKTISIQTVMNICDALVKTDKNSFDNIFKLVMSQDIDTLQKVMIEDSSIVDTNVISSLDQFLSYMMDDVVTFVI